jgi:hypothetical protein
VVRAELGELPSRQSGLRCDRNVWPARMRSRARRSLSQRACIHCLSNEAIGAPLVMGCAQKGQVLANFAVIAGFAGFATAAGFAVVAVALFPLRTRLILPVLL